MKIVSACLLGVNCRYDGGNSYNRKIVQLVNNEVLIPVCPEQLGGLTTPREAAKIMNGGGSAVLDGKAKVIDERGQDVTKNLVSGAEEVVKLASLFGVNEAIMKSGSPSCGCGGSEDGVTTAILKRRGILVKTEKEYE
jgi:uncharacterized protein YbbK (DUF523 family)